MNQTETVRPGPSGKNVFSGWAGICAIGILPVLWMYCRGEPAQAEPAGRMVRAGAEDLIWLVVGLFWAIAQFAGAAAKKKAAERRRSRPAEEQEKPPLARDRFAELMSEITGAQTFDVPEPEAVAEELPADHPVRRITPAAETSPDIVSMRQAAAIEGSNVKPIDRKAKIEDASVRPIEEVETHVRPRMSSFRRGIPSIRLPSIPSMNRTIDVPSYTEAASGTQGIGKELHLKNRKALRRAILSHIIFSPPKALEKQTR